MLLILRRMKDAYLPFVEASTTLVKLRQARFDAKEMLKIRVRTRNVYENKETSD